MPTKYSRQDFSPALIPAYSSPCPPGSQGPREAKQHLCCLSSPLTLCLSLTRWLATNLLIERTHRCLLSVLSFIIAVRMDTVTVHKMGRQGDWGNVRNEEQT